jgi:geranylgeranyl pyrophosphate synthase
MVGGQVLDLLGEDRDLSAPELDDLHSRKTGALLTAPLVMGALAAGGTPAEVSAFRAYGVAVGLAFQVADDILDATSSAEALGKNPSDQELNKSTYVSLHGLNEARARADDLVGEASAALLCGGIESPNLESVARYIVERDR